MVLDNEGALKEVADVLLLFVQVVLAGGGQRIAIVLDFLVKLLVCLHLELLGALLIVLGIKHVNKKRKELVSILLSESIFELKEVKVLLIFVDHIDEDIGIDLGVW